MLSYSLPATQTTFVCRAHTSCGGHTAPEWRGGGACQLRMRRYTRLIGRWDCQPRTRRWKPFCQRTNALLFSARRTNYLRVPCATPPTEGAPHPNGGAVELVSPARGADNRFARERMLAHSVPTVRTLFPHHTIIIVVGYGALPHVQEWPLTFSRPTDRNAELTSPARDVASQSARKHMLAHSLFSGPAFYPFSAHRTHLLPALPHSIFQ